MTSENEKPPSVTPHCVERIRRGLQEKGWRQAELARRSEVSPMLLSEILRGKRTPSIAVIFRVSEALEVEIDEFFPKSD